MIAMWLFSGVVLAFIMAGALCILLATWYDVRQSWVYRYSDTRKRGNPTITAVIVVGPGSSRLHETVTSIKKIGGKSVDIVIAVPVELSGPERKNLRKYAKSAYVYRARASHTMQQLAAHAYRRSKRRNLVLLLDADTPLVSGTLRDASRWLLEDDQIGGVGLGQDIITPKNMNELVDVFAELSRRFMSKALSITGLYWLDKPRCGQLIRREIITGSARYRTVFDSRVAITPGPTEISRRLRAVSYGVAIIVILTMVYACVLAAYLKAIEPLLLSWSAVTLWLCSIFWLDDSLGFRQRMESLLYVSIGYFVVFAQLLIMVFVRPLLRRTF